MTTLANSPSWPGRAAASNRLAFAVILMARRFRRALARRNGRSRFDRLPAYLLADIGLRRNEVETATIWGRSRL